MHVVWKMVVGGAECMLLDIVRVQAETNEVHVISIDRDSATSMLQQLDSRVKFYSCGRSHGSHSPFPILKLNAYLCKVRPDVIHTHFGKIYKCIFTPWIAKVRTIHNTTNDIGEYSHYDRCFAISRSVAEEWKQAGRDVPVITNGINCDLIKSRDFTAEKPPGDVLHFIQVSRLLVEQKGQDLLIEALAILRDELEAGHSKRFVMHFVGGGPDEAMLKEMVIERDLGNYVVFEGVKDRRWVYENLCDFDLFIQPSRFEGFGLTVAEACAAGIPVLVCDNEGPMEVIDNGRLGLKFKTGDYHDLAAKLVDFTINGYKNELLIKAYDFTRANFDVSRTAREYIHAYHSIVKD